MNEVEKLYSLAGVEKKEYGYCSWDCDCPYTDCEDIHCDNSCPYWKIEKVAYPPFTAEKQLELIKWLGELDLLEIIRTTREDKAWIINSEYGMSGNIYKHTSRMKSFEETIAGLINNLWQDLTDIEKAQIKNILER